MKKRICSWLLTFCMLLLCFPMGSEQLVYAEEEQYEYIYIRPGNIENIFDYNAANHIYGWTLESGRAGSFGNILMRRESRAPGLPDVNKEIYIKEAGEYRIMARVWNLDDEKASTRVFALSIDGNKISHPFGADYVHNAWKWDMGFTIYLTEGLHTITYGGPSNSYGRTDGVLITNNLELIPPNTYDATIQSWEDYTAPTWDEGAELVATDVAETSAVVQWSQASDNKEVLAYEIYRNDTKVAVVPELSYHVDNLTPGTAYNFKVVAIDALYNKSEPLELNIITLGETDTEKPIWPENSEIIPTVQGINIKLNWTEAQDNYFIEEYEVYLNDELYAIVKSPECEITDLLPITEYSIKIRAKDGAGLYTEDYLTATVTTGRDPNVPFDDKQYIFYYPDQFDQGGWEYQRNQQNTFKEHSIFAPQSSGISPAEVKVYVPKAEDYAIWVHTIDYVNDRPGTRTFQIEVNGQVDDYIYGQLAITEGLDGYQWDGGFSFEFHEGENIIRFVNPKSYARIDGLLITNDLGYIPVNKWVGGIEHFEDDVKPSWEQGAILELSNITSESMSLNWPDAVDNKGIAIYEIYKDEELVAAVPNNTNSYDVIGLEPETLYHFKVIAKDYNGNPSDALIASEETTSTNKFDVLSYEFSYESGIPADTIVPSEILSCSVEVKSVKSEVHSGVVILALYDDQGRLNTANFTKEENINDLESKNIVVNLPIPSNANQDYIVKVLVWDSLSAMRPQNNVIFFND